MIYRMSVAGGKITRMTDHVELSLRWEGKSARRWIAVCVLFAVAAGVAACLGVPDARDWGILSGVVGASAAGCVLGMLRRRVEAGPDGLRFRTVLRWRRLEWNEIARLEDLRVAAADTRIRTPNLRVAATLRDGSMVSLPVPWAGAADVGDFEKQLSQLRALHRRYSRSTLGS
ncbi:PH domain-containing protein [Streptomyces sp. WM6378]|uniref:PH domain-containing protein n=1 Tax=Streptomyces sp. WM6378 TaxID=1415557 RepID=UPI00099C0C36|nr:PH domain-containing protein [Streptomyces sp. WM6378]